ncbi:LolA family protein [Breznakiellaceae bacterium SP9]
MNTRYVEAMVFSLLLLTGLAHLTAQQIITAERYLEMVGDRYKGIRDYEASINIVSGSQTMNGTVSHLAPSFLRIDFYRPAEQVIVYNGELLTIYLPEYKAVLNQGVSPSSGATIASSSGLALLRRNYVPAFVSGPDPVPIDAGASEMAVKLRLTRRSTSEGFREIILSINNDSKLIRRMEGRTVNGGSVRFDFYNIRLNIGIPELRFIYDSPASANMYNNFLFRNTD